MKLKVFFLFIILGGFLLRVIQLNSLPVILNRDEAALAYNAYLLQHTGKDEWGHQWPLALQSFGDYKLLGYPALLVPFFSMFDSHDWVVRLPSALGGTALIYLAYLFVKKVLKLEKKWAVFAAFLIAVQPVFFFYSRIAFEANVALSLFVTGVIILFQSNTKIKVWQEILAIVLFLCAIFTYNTPLLLLPFLLPLLIVQRGWQKPKRWIVVVAGLMIVMCIGFASLASLSKQKSGITIFSDETLWMQSVQYHDQFQGVAQKILGNKAIFFGRIILQHYVATFGPEFLVIKGGTHPWHQLPGFGHLFWLTYILAAVGIGSSFFFVLKKKKSWTIHHTLLYLLIISPLPSVVTVDSPHATRSLFVFFLLIMFAIIGVHTLCQQFKKTNLIVYVCTVLLLIESFQYYVVYFTVYPSQSNAILKGGYEPFINQVEESSGNQKIAVVDDSGFQYILTAWYLKMSPETFFATVAKHLPDRIGFRYGYRVGKYRFIVSPDDRFADETKVIWWNDVSNTWEVK